MGRNKMRRTAEKIVAFILVLMMAVTSVLTELPVKNFFPIVQVRAEEETPDKVTIETEYYTISVPAWFAEKYTWDINTFEWTHTLQFYDRATREAGGGQETWRFSLQMCAYVTDVYMHPGEYVLGDIWIGSSCWAMLTLLCYEKGTPEYEALWDDMAWVINRIKWKDNREFTWRTIFSWTDVYRQFAIGAKFCQTDAYPDRPFFYRDEDFRISVYDTDGDGWPEFLVTNASTDPDLSCIYVYRWREESMNLVGQIKEAPEEAEFWTRGEIMKKGWNAFVKAMGYGLYTCDPCLDFSMDILVPVPDYASMTPFERQVILKAQEIYDSAMQSYPTVEKYVYTRVRDRREEDLKTLRQSENYRVYNKYSWDFCKLGMTAILGTVTQNAETIYSVFAEVMLDAAIENSSLNGYGERVVNGMLEDLNIDVPDMNTEEYIYSLARQGAKKISVGGLIEAMQVAERRGGKFFTFEDAARFILIWQKNEEGFAALDMGVAYYNDQLKKPPLEVLKELLLSIALSTVVGKITKAELMQDYLNGKILDFMGEKLDGIVGSYNNPFLNTYRDKVKKIWEETWDIFTPPVTFDIVRKDALMNIAAKYTPEVPEIPEGFTFYRDFTEPEAFPAEVAADYLEIVEQRINLYGTEHMGRYSGVLYGYKAGLSGGWLTDLNKDGIPEMILILRSGDGWYQDPTEAQYEVWTWEDGTAYQMFFGELERINQGGMNESSEYLNIWVGKNGTYLEMGYAPSMYQDIVPESMSTERWFMTYDENGYFRRMQTNPADEDLVRRIPVAAGNLIHLANQYAFLDCLSKAAGKRAEEEAALALSQVTYVGDPDKCIMSGKMARAYAENLRAETTYPVDTVGAHFLQAILVDAGDDGVPLLVKAAPYPNPSFWPEGDGHFIADAMLCYFDGQKVREYPFLNDVATVYGWSDYPPQIYVSLITSEQRGGGVPILAVTVYGYAKGTQESAGETIYYFVNKGRLELFHRLTTVYTYPDYQYMWDGEGTTDPDGCLRKAALDHEEETFLYFMNLADQNAKPGTTALTMANLLEAYAANR